MAEDSRDYPRAQLPAVRARYENAAGVTLEAEVLDIGQGGVFIKTEAPLPPGKRLAFELIVLGEPRPIPVVARVVWVRAIAASEARPEGMGLKFIDLDEDAVGQIGALVHTRERTMQGIGFPGLVATPEIDPELLAGNPPASGDAFVAEAREGGNASLRERTLAGGFDESGRSPRERTLIGVEADPRGEATGGIRGRTPEGAARKSQASLSGERERSIPLGLVTKKPHVDEFETHDRPSSPSDDTQPSRLRASQFQKSAPRRTGLKWAWAIVVVAGAGGAGYAYRDRLTGFVRAASEPEKTTLPSAPPVVDVVDASGEMRPDAAETTAKDAESAIGIASVNEAGVNDAGVNDAGAIDAHVAAQAGAGKADAHAHGGAAVVQGEPAASSMTPSSASSSPKKPATRPKPKARPKPEDDNPY